MDKPTAHIENWFQAGNTLFGQISNHVRQEEFHASMQQTSRIVSAPDGFKKGATVETENTYYVLGDMAMSSH